MQTFVGKRFLYPNTTILLHVDLEKQSGLSLTYTFACSKTRDKLQLSDIISTDGMHA